MHGRELQFKAAEISYYLHGTEEYDRVIASMVKTLSIPSEQFSMENTEGHYGNPIRILKAHLVSREALNFVTSFLERMPISQKTALLGEINRSLNEHGDLFVRLNKQDLLLGRLTLGEIDPVRIKIKLRYNMSRNAVIEAYGSLLKG